MRIRITFTKQGPLRYTGHLDLHKLWERAARRAALPLAYSQGFHPQPKMNIAAALPLGFSSICEVLDMRIKQEIPLDGLAQRLQDTLPAGIRILNIERVDDSQPALQTQVASAEYEVTLTESMDRFELERKIASVMESASLPRERRGKSYDLRPLIEELNVLESNSLLLEQAPGLQKIFMRLSAREGATGRPEEVLDVLGIAFEGTRIERTKLHFNLAKVGESTQSVSQPNLQD
ncbi:MAG TPA: TIGR03936 family radical SAM-associated protein [Anaerolineales bacterium]|nr:TIGR03936 family radical SAM-associated protein [Anaerolineales bacterium]